MNRSLDKVFELYVVAYSFFFASKPLSDPDFWFHLKTGEYIFRNAGVPRTDLFSFTHYGRPWIAHGWLSGAIFYGIYSRLGFNFLILLFALLAALAFWIVFRRCNSHPLVAGLTTLLGVWTVLPTIGVRPRVFSLLFASIYLAVLTQYARRGTGRSIWWLIPLMALWVNLHGGFFIGFALIGLTIIGLPLDAWATSEKFSSVWPRVKVLVIVLLGCLLAGMLNPYGPSMYIFLVKVLTSPVFQNLVLDWLSPNFHDATWQPLLVLILLTIAAFALSREKVRPSQLLFFLVTLYSTLKMQRNVAIFALVAVPLFADYFQNWLESTSLGESFGHSWSAGSRPLQIALSLLLLLPLLILGAKLKSTAYAPLRQETSKVPLKAVEYLKEKQITGKTFTDPNIWGGYLIWALPSNPVYIDGRDVYPEEFVKEYAEIIKGNSDWRAPLDRYGVRIVLIKPQTLLARQFEESTEWERVYQDEMSVVFSRR